MGIKSFVKDLAKGITNIGKFFTKFKKSKKDLDVTKTTKKNTKAIKDATKTIKAESQAKQQNVEVTKTENTANIQEAQSETVAAKSSQQSAAADTKEATATGQATTADTVETAGNVGEATTEIVAAKSSDASAKADTKEVIASNKSQKADMKESITNIFESLTEGAANAAQNIPVAGVFIALGLLAAAGIALAVSMANVNGAFDNDYGAQKKAENINKLSGEIYELTERARALDSVVDSFDKIDNKVIKTKADIEEMNSLLEQAGDELSDEIGEDEDIGYGKGVSAQEAYKALTREADKIAFLEAEANRNRKLANDKRQEQLKIFNNARSYEKSQLLYGSDAQYVNARSAIYGINNNTLYESIDALKELEGADEEVLAATEELVQGLLEQLDITDALAIANEDADSTIKELINELQDLEATEQFLNEDENFIDRVKAFRELTAALSDNQDMLDALKEAYSE